MDLWTPQTTLWELLDGAFQSVPQLSVLVRVVPCFTVTRPSTEHIPLN